MQAFLRWVTCAALVSAPTLPHAGEEPSAMHQALESAFVDWLGSNGTTGLIGASVRDTNGSWQTHRHITRADTGATVADLASVSKSITAVCMMDLVDDGLADWSNPLHNFVEPAPDVTLGELVTHTSGIGPDVTQIAMLGWLGQTAGDSGHFSRQVLDLVNARGELGGTRGQYNYNNENYAILGLAIETITGQPFFEACAERLELPASIQPGPESGVFQPWGGLASDVDGYLQFMQTHFGEGSRIASDPFALPHVALGGGAYYGMGMVFRPFRDSYNFWHFGALCFPNRLRTGSFAVIWEGKVGVLAMYDECIDEGAMGDLDATLSAAVFGDRP
ncbi:serine hydrolase [Tateyamaria omphalii]|uniref:serine hydrolase domain-containing protein n=2 Tax=Roseobacteraceae TaxID=2854170 RepID=UPI001C99864B|nr:serine hydrolase [Tateyamaria omphalii]MBY5934396.1 serine hydrolase [Tateyamaria omphalii]